MPDEGVLDRAQGALLGLATGDALGTTLEFKPPGSFTPIDDLVGGGPFDLDAGQWTDDTSMALCLAESLLDRGRHDPVDQLRRYVNWHRNGYFSSTGQCFDIGATTARQLERFETTGVPNDPVSDQEAAANGSPMRLAGVPIRWHASPQDAAEWSGRSSMPTHAARRPVDACRVMGAMTAALIGGQPADDVLHGRFWTFGPLHDEVAAVTAGSWQRREPPEIRGTGYCVDALEAALWAVGGATDFADAVLRAANLGDDADTTAAIAGQLAGARWGASGIPATWRSKLTLGTRITSLARNLALAGGAEARRATSGLPAWEDEALVHAWWVRPDQVLAGEYPGHRDAARARAKLSVLVDHGVRTFVDLTRPHDGLDAYDATLATIAAERGLDLRRVSMPIPDMSVVDDAAYDPILAAIDDAAERSAAYVHCWGGMGRTGTVVGCLLVDEGLDGAAALRRVAELRADSGKARQPAPQTVEQREVVLRRGRMRP
jgi:ADP-ribosylglycohydrolase